jgi:hypothetical protein
MSVASFWVFGNGVALRQALLPITSASLLCAWLGNTAGRIENTIDTINKTWRMANPARNMAIVAQPSGGSRAGLDEQTHPANAAYGSAVLCLALRIAWFNSPP